MLEHVMSEITRWLIIFEEEDWPGLIVVALVVIRLARMFCPNDYRGTYAKWTASLLTMPYLIHVYPRLSVDEFSLIGTSLFRLALLYSLLLGPCLIIVPFILSICRRASGKLGVWKRSWQECGLERRERRERRRQEKWAKKNPPPPPVPRSEHLQTQAQHAQQEYETEAALIAHSPILDQAEKHAALMFAKQRYLQRMKAVLQ